MLPKVLIARLAAAASVALLIALVPVGTGAAAGAPVDNQVQQEVGNGGTTTFFVVLKEQADLTGAAALSGSDRVGAVVSALKATATRAQATAVARLQAGQRNGHVKSFTPLWAVDGIIVSGDAQAVADLAHLGETQSIVHNAKIQLEPEAAAPAGSIEASVGWNIAAIRANQAWPQVTGAGVLVGLIDTGADYRHPAISAKYARDGDSHLFSWLDTINGRTVPYDDNGHGTHTTGTVLGDFGIGVAPDARWIMAKVFAASGSSTSDKILPAMQWMLAPGGDPGHAPQIVSNSWGGSCSEGDTAVFQPMVRAWVAAGIVPVFSNGNDGPAPETVGRPACYPESFGVGALDYGSYTGIAIRTSPGGPGPFVGVEGSGPPVADLKSAYRFVGTACTTLAPLAADLKIALVERGVCSFALKAANAKAAGALAMVVYNNVEGSPPAMGGIPATGIPGVSVTLADGGALKSFETTPGAELRLDPATRLSSTPFTTPIIAGFSSRGPSPFDDLLKPNVSAPGVNVRSSFPGGGYAHISGTSMAAPHVAGTAALMLQANRGLSITAIRSIIQSTSHPLGSPVPNDTYGYGAIDAYAAVQAALGVGEEAA